MAEEREATVEVLPTETQRDAIARVLKALTVSLRDLDDGC